MRAFDSSCYPDGRSHKFFLLFLDREHGPLAGSLVVSPMVGGLWRTEWDIGTIDKAYKLSDHWFCQDPYEQKFMQVLQTAADKSDSPHFEIPGATSRWGFAKGQRKKNALALAIQVLALWEEIIMDWEACGADDEPAH